MMRWISTSVCCAVATLALVKVPASTAGTYLVQTCADAPSGANRSWTAQATLQPKLEVTDGCATAAASGLGVEDVLGASNSAGGDSVRWRFSAPAGTSITQLSYTRLLYKEDDDDWVPGLWVDGGLRESCSILYPAARCRVGGPGSSPVQTTNDAAHEIEFGVLCQFNDANACVNGGTMHKAVAVLYGATVTLSDPSSPSVSNVGGPLFDSGYVSGSRSVSFDASDNSGIRSSRVFVDGVPLPTRDFPCDFTYAVPCSNQGGASLSVDTRDMSDGSHLVEVAARDAALNETRTSARTVVVDNTAPAAPDDLSVVGGGDWRPSNDFSLAWTTPNGQVSPVAAAVVSVCDSDGFSCQNPVRYPGADITRIDGVSVPTTGTWTARVWLEDSAGNVDPGSGSAVTLRYGSAPAAPAAPSGTVAAAPAASSPAADPIGADQAAADALQSPTTVLTPTTLLSPSLRITSARFAHGRLVIRGSTAPGARGSVSFRLRTAHGVTTLRRSLPGGAFRLSVRVARKPRAPLKLAFAANALFAPQSATARVR